MKLFAKFFPVFVFLYSVAMSVAVAQNKPAPSRIPALALSDAPAITRAIVVGKVQATPLPAAMPTPTVATTRPVAVPGLTAVVIAIELPLARGVVNSPVLRSEPSAR